MAHFEFVWWPFLLLLPLPLAVYFLLPPAKSETPIYLPYLPTNLAGTSVKNHFSKLLAGLIWGCLLVACARPVWYGEPVIHQPEHRDLMLVVDLSGSMEQEDMLYDGDYVDRLSAVKRVLSDFIAQREGDRLGLVFFADHAYLQTPLTFDRHAVSEQLNQSVLNLIGAKTAIGEGIGLATKTFVDSKAPQRVIVLLSDGSNTAGVLDPIEAAKIAKKYHATIYTVGVGAGEMEVKQFFFSRKVNTARDLDEDTLSKIAQLTGGQYFRARNSDELSKIYQTINQMEPISQATQTWRPQQEWFRYPLAIALLLSVTLIIVRRDHV
ncbi:vWA domain-containing protein [Vibrio panuliri]|uniref:IMP dehydrogenase n=1 Tax=Vibrio panuliri TaxID=1381081 RepID=A0ABX3F9J9_9VIBR|nr:VWA domain-containing protein [Vibrio panuliri]KAB1457650.1 VWA domain-containing protein [Vibrio panuliri]OLQ87298.1 IMP dehydrogenase [Vibrio panuliri]